MKPTIKAVALAATLAMPAMAADNTGYARIKKDVSVMTRILKGAFESEGQHRYGISIDSNYLAHQGAVFTVHSPRYLRSYSFRMGDFGDSDGNVVVLRGAPEPNPDVNVSISDTVSEIVSQIDLDALDDVDWEQLAEVPGMPGYQLSFGNEMRVSRETRAALREVSRELREIEREISDNRIELIHDEDNRKEVEQEIAKLEKQRVDVEAKRDRLQEKLEAERQKLKEQQTEMREKALQARKEHIANLEQVVMQTLCDYGSTLKNLPDDEHVSVVLESVPSSDTRQVYVLGKKDVTGCNSGGAGLAKSATKYSF